MSVTESNATRKASAIVDLMTLYFSYPRIKGILLWGFWDGKINDPDNALWEGGNATTVRIKCQMYKTIYIKSVFYDCNINMIFDISVLST